MSERERLPLTDAVAGTPFCRVEGTFYRAVDPAWTHLALAGSRGAGRFSPPGVRTLYLSSSREGVTAAMIAHAEERAQHLAILPFDVTASRIIDLRDAERLEQMGLEPDAAAAPWQDDVHAGRIPPSWRVRDAAVRLGAQGLIDPSRKRPGLWHLVLFAWNQGDATVVLPAQE